jgi:flagellar basal-body rod protein FlgG
MNDVMAIGLQAMQTDATRLARVGTNLANATTPGYKRELAGAQASLVGRLSFAELVEAQAVPIAAEAAEPGAVIGGVLRDMRVGTFRTTGQPLDLALTGRGFFEVATPAGPAYTRHGQFQLDARGRVVTAEGHALMGSGGEIVLTGTPVIDASGAVSENGRVVARLRIVDFEASERLERVDGGYAGGRLALPVDESAAQVRQGQLENANVDSAREMVELIRTMRHFESMQRVVQSYDDMLGTGIRKLGDV